MNCPTPLPSLRKICLAAALAFAAIARGQSASPAPAVSSPPQPSPVETDPAYHKLDFWLGDWEVFDFATKVRDGHNRIERVLKGAAIVENWADANGSEGKSWFYYYRPEKRWKQIWVTDGGMVKEKALVEEFPDGGVRFRGEIPRRDGTKITDQTTLTPLPEGRVRQVIEWSKDGGQTWETVYDAIYLHPTKS